MMMTDFAPTLSLPLAIARGQMLAQIRHFFAQKNVLEIQTPILSHAGNTDVYIQSVQTWFHQAGKPTTGYLHTSPEFAMKRVLADYRVPIYQLCQVFRDDEKGKKHNIEFTMLEWYRPDFDLDMLADELHELLCVVLNRPLTLHRLSYAQSFLDKLHIHPFSASIQTLKDTALTHGITLDMGDDRQGWLDLLFSHLIEPDLGFDAPTLVVDYPVATAALAKTAIDADGHVVARRFELYINGIEIANAYDELADGDELAKRFMDDNAKRTQLGLPAMPIDTRLLSACQHLPACSGIALGVDRLFMVRECLADISEAMMFTTDKA